MDKHDFTERRWLTPAHRAALDAGTLDVPDRVNDHPAILVSIPANWDTTPVAWVDRGVAEIVHHAARLGAPTAESCENAGHNGGAYGWPDMPMLWFNDRAGLDRFARILTTENSDGLLWFEPRRWFPRKRDRVCAVAIPPDQMQKVTSHLARLGTP